MAKPKRPQIYVRYRTITEFEKVKRAARLEGLSLNLYIVKRTTEAAVRALTLEQQKKAAASEAGEKVA